MDILKIPSAEYIKDYTRLDKFIKNRLLTEISGIKMCPDLKHMVFINGQKKAAGKPTALKIS